jgi:hypothetical protein
MYHDMIREGYLTSMPVLPPPAFLVSSAFAKFLALAVADFA